MMDASSGLTHRARSIRIAIAIAVLRHKPQHQTFDSYVLDLRATFVPRETAALYYNAWRQKALALEKKLHEAEVKHQNERVELAALQARMSQQTSALPPGGNTKTKGQKPKKKAGGVVPGPMEGFSKAADVLDRMAASTFSSLNLLSSIQHLEILTEELHVRRKRPPGNVFFLACRRTVDALATLLSSALSCTPPSDDAPTALDALTLLCPQLVTLVLPILAREPRKKNLSSDQSSLALDDLVGKLTMAVLVPLLRSFSPASDAFYAALSKPNSRHPSAVVDLRPRLCSLLHLLVSALIETAASSSSIRLSTLVHDTIRLLALETVRELDKLFTEPTLGPAVSTLSETVDPKPGPSLEEVLKLARKDALWYLCATMHLLLDAWDRGKGSLLLQEAIYTGLSALFRRTRPGAAVLVPPNPIGPPPVSTWPEHSEGVAERRKECGESGWCGIGSASELGKGDADGWGMDEAEREMMLAVVEKYWLKVV